MSDPDHQRGACCGGRAAPDENTLDPVCGMAVSAESVHRLEAGGRTVLFCSAACRSRFVDGKVVTGA